MISIITPSYNSAKFIGETIKSVRKQTYQDWEMLIVDDCSTDNSKDIIKEYSDNDARIKLIALEKNVGAAEARNIALRKAKGRYIAFLDSDDLWLPEKLNKQLAFMKKTKIDFSFTAYNRISESGKYINTIPVPKTIDYHNFLKNTVIGTLTVMIDRESTGYFEMPIIKSSHDMALWCKLLRNGRKAYGINETLAQYRVVSNSNTSKKLKAALDVWKVLRQHEKINFLKSAYYFSNYAFNAAKKRI
jgi:teichuronic acid biosynthesis glycosyltransferase TuaG